MLSNNQEDEGRCAIVAYQKQKEPSEADKRFLAQWGINPFPSLAACVRAIYFIRDGNGTYGDDAPARANIVIGAQNEWTNVRVRFGGSNRTGTVVFPFFLYYREIADRQLSRARRDAEEQGTQVKDEFIRQRKGRQPSPFRLMVRWDDTKRMNDAPLSCIERITDPPVGA